MHLNKCLESSFRMALNGCTQNTHKFSAQSSGAIQLGALIMILGANSGQEFLGYIINRQITSKCTETFYRNHFLHIFRCYRQNLLLSICRTLFDSRTRMYIEATQTETNNVHPAKFESVRGAFQVGILSADQAHFATEI